MQRRIISRRTFLKTAAVASATLTTANILTGCAAPAAGAAGDQAAADANAGSDVSTLNFSWIGDISPWWHPARYQTFSQAVIFQIMFSHLVKLDGTLQEVVGDLAESWEVSDDATEFTFNLRQNVKWHDGEPFSADDVVYSFSESLRIPMIVPNRLEGLVGAAEYASGDADSVAGIEKIDDYTVKLTLAESDSTFLWNLRDTNYVITPKHLLENAAPDQIENHPFTLETPVGTGPYKFVQWVTDQFAEFEAYDDFHLGRPKIDKMIMKRLTTDVTVAQLEAGDVQLGVRLNPIDFDRLSEAEQLNVISVPGVGITAISALHTNPRMADKRVRQALYYGIDRRTIVETVLQGRAKVLEGAPPRLDHFDDLDPYAYNPEKAKRLLEEAGFELYVGQGGDTGVHPDRQLVYYHCDKPDVATGYNACAEVDMLQSARQTAVTEEQDALYHDVARSLNDEVPQLWLWQLNDLHAADKRLGGGFAISPDAKTTFWNVHEWELDA